MKRLRLCCFFAVLLFASTPAFSQLISVNFHVGDDLEGQDAHVFDGVETAGVGECNTAAWNNVSVGVGGGNSATEIFPATSLADAAGNATAATLSSTLTTGVDSSWFVGYANSAATAEAELGDTVDGAGGDPAFDASDNNLFNSYLALNSPSGDETPLDNFVLNVSGLGPEFTSGGYDLVIYSDSDRRGTTGGNVRQSIYTLTPAGGGDPIQAFVEDDDPVEEANIFEGCYIISDGVEDGADYSNYTVITGLTAASFDLEITSPDGGRGAISGFQIKVGLSHEAPSKDDCLLGDVDLSGVVDFLDIQPFVNALTTGEFQCEADANEDDVVDFLDIGPFIAILSSQ